ncbi:MAG: hypothetical protein ABH868_02850 [bacterium]
MANPLAAKIEEYLTPLLGKIMAQATIKVQCKNIGITVEQLSLENLAGIAERIEKALVIFVGSEKAKKTADEIKNFS